MNEYKKIIADILKKQYKIHEERPNKLRNQKGEKKEEEKGNRKRINKRDEKIEKDDQKGRGM